MTELSLIGIGFLMGVLLFPFLLFIRARRSPGWDRSNLVNCMRTEDPQVSLRDFMNIYRVIAHLGIRPEDFADMRYSDGRRPFWYIGKDEFSGVVKTNRVSRRDQD